MIPYMNEWVWDRTSSYKILADSNLDWGQDAGVVRKFLKANPDVVLDPETPTTGRILVSADGLLVSCQRAKAHSPGHCVITRQRKSVMRIFYL